jgi:hypothetical protein
MSGMNRPLNEVPRRRLAYLAATLGLLALGSGYVMATGAERAFPWIAGGLTAWLIQAPAYWVLVDRLERGLDATRPWFAGMGARLGGFAILAVASWVTDLPAGPIAAAYGMAMIAFLILEAVWLASPRSNAKQP